MPSSFIDDDTHSKSISKSGEDTDEKSWKPSDDEDDGDDGSYSDEYSIYSEEEEDDDEEDDENVQIVLTLGGGMGPMLGSKRARSGDEYTPEELAYLDSLSDEQREEMKERESDLKDISNTNVPHRFAVLSSKHNRETKKYILSKLKELRSNPNNSKLESWMNFAVHQLPVGIKKMVLDVPDVKEHLHKCRKMLDTAVYGLEETKEQVMMTLAKIFSSGSSKGNLMAIGLQGPPGVGKTTIAKVIGQALNVPTIIIPMGGASDGAYLEGFALTYEGSAPGKIAQSLAGCGCEDPVILLDEIDKISELKKQEVNGVLTHLVDRGEGDSMFVDKYLGFPINLGNTLPIATMNDISRVDPILLNRMHIIHVDGYNSADKRNILKNFTLPRLLSNYGIDINISEDALNLIISTVGDEPGMRRCSQILENVLAKVNLKSLMDGVEMKEISEDFVKKALNVKPQNVSLAMMYC